MEKVRVFDPQSLSQDSLKDRVVDWATDQNRRAVGYIGSDAHAYNTRSGLNRVLMGGIHAPETEKRGLVIEVGAPGAISYQAAHANTMARGVGADWEIGFSDLGNSATPVWDAAVVSQLKAGSNDITAGTPYGLAECIQYGMEIGNERFNQNHSVGLKQFLLNLDSEPTSGFGQIEIEGLGDLNRFDGLPSHLSHFHHGWEVDPITGTLQNSPCTLNWSKMQILGMKDRKAFKCGVEGRHYHTAIPKDAPEKERDIILHAHMLVAPKEKTICGFPWIEEQSPRLGGKSETTWNAKVKLGTIKIAKPLLSALETVRVAPEVGVFDAVMYNDIVQPVLTDRVIRLQEEQKAAELDHGGSSISLTKIQGVQRFEVLIQACRQEIARVAKVQRVIEAVVDNRPRGADFKWPLITKARPGVKLNVTVQKGKVWGEDLKEQVIKLHKDLDLDKVTTLAPSQSFDEKGRPLPLDKATEQRLLSDIGHSKSGRKLSASSADRAWRDVIIAFNAARNIHGLDEVDLHKRLTPKDPVASKKQDGARAVAADVALRAKLTEVSSTLDQVRRDQTDFANSVGEIIKTMAAKLMATKLETVNPATQQPLNPALATAQLESMIKAEVAKLQPTPVEVVVPSPVPSDDESAESESSDDDADAPAPTITRRGVEWVEFRPELIPEGSAMLVAVSPIDGRVYAYPHKVELPNGDERVNVFNRLHLVREPNRGGPPPIPSKPGKEQGEKPAAKVVQEDKAPDSTLDSMVCPDCSAIRPNSHKEDCGKSAWKWGKLSKEGRQQRADLLKGKTPPTKKAKEVKPPQDPIAAKDPLAAVPEKRELTSEQDAELRKHFGTLPKPSEADLADLSKEERTARIKSSQLPRWAVAATLSDDKNLKGILSGTLTLLKYQAGEFSRGAASKQLTTKQVGDMWNQLKGKHPGVPLLEKPRSDKEKKLKQEFDHLRARAGSDHPALPKPRKASGGRSASPAGRTNAGNTQLQGLAELAATFKVLRDAFK